MPEADLQPSPSPETKEVVKRKIGMSLDEVIKADSKSGKKRRTSVKLVRFCYYAFSLRFGILLLC